MAFNYAGWPLPAGVYAGWTDRTGGASGQPFESFNVAHHVGDSVSNVALNRTRLQASLTGNPAIVWLNQTHSTEVIVAEAYQANAAVDASYTRQAQLACCVMTADCLPVFFWSHDGEQIAVAHAGWRGLADGILVNTAKCFQDLSRVSCGLGPAIGPAAFEVGEDVKAAFAQWSQHANAFTAAQQPGKYFADLTALATSQLLSLGVAKVYASELCTFSHSDQFYSYRRDGQTGRMANLIWKADPR